MYAIRSYYEHLDDNEEMEEEGKSPYEESDVYDLTGIYSSEEETVPIDYSDSFPEERRASDGSSDRRTSEYDDRRVGDRRRVSRSETNGKHSIDPMNIYLREMGTLALLSHEEELKLARMMEEGKQRVQNAVLTTPLALPALLEIVRGMDQSPQKISQVIMGIPDRNNFV